MRDTTKPTGPRKMGSYIPLLYAFGRKQLPPRIFTGNSRPGTCRTFLPHANDQMHPSCRRCGKTRSLHV